MSRKPRVLWVGESSYLNSGYAIYGRELLSRLHATGKYELAEFGIYGKWDDKKRAGLPWHFYGNMPDSDKDRPMYDGDPINQFGQWKLEHVLMDFKPDIVLDMRDWWMSESIQRSPFRKNFHWIYMPTVDSKPQLDQWLYTYSDADTLLAYTEFSQEYLESCGMEVAALAPPAADYDVFKMAPDKSKHRDNAGFNDDIFIIGTIMRNQRRKLYPDLMEAFKEFITRHKELGHKTFLYIHASYPDNGWDIPHLILEHGLGHKVLCTYICNKCRHLFPSFFSDALQACPKCKKLSATLPNVQLGATPQELAGIINLFDLYVQYSICEGFGMPMVEAAACGVPVVAVDYSAMESVTKNLGSYKVKVERYFKEPESTNVRALPDNEHLIQIIHKYLSLPEPLRVKKAREHYQKSRRCYDWDNTAKVWETMIDRVELKDHAKTWDRPYDLPQPNMRIPDRLSNEQFAQFLISEVAREPDKINSFMALRLIRDLNYGHKTVGTGGFFQNEDSLQARNRYKKFSKEQAVEEMLRIYQFKQQWEAFRTGRDSYTKPIFVKEAGPKDGSINVL